MRRARARLVMAAVIVLGACGGSGSGAGDEDRLVAGPCVVIYAQPVISLQDATDSVTALPVGSVVITDVTYRGVKLSTAVLTNVAQGVTASGDTLVCSLPCGFATGEGDYSFTVKASGYRDQTRTVSAAYPQAVGGCPLTYSGTTAVSVRLTPL